MTKKWFPVPGFIGFVTLIAEFLIQDWVLLMSKWNIITWYLVIFNFRVGYLKKSSGRVGYRDPVGPCLGLVDGKITQDSLWATSERKYRTWCWKRWVTQSWKMDFPFFISTDPTQSVYFISCCISVNKDSKVTHDSLRATDFILKNQIFFLFFTPTLTLSI